MHYLRYMAILGVAACLPWQALAADTKTPAATPAASAEVPQSKGFDKYWEKKTGSADGEITKAQWMEESEKKFKEIDTNGDGKISKAEMQAFQDRMRAHYLEMKAKREQGDSK